MVVLSYLHLGSRPLPVPPIVGGGLREERDWGDTPQPRQGSAPCTPGDDCSIRLPNPGGRVGGVGGHPPSRQGRAPALPGDERRGRLPGPPAGERRCTPGATAPRHGWQAAPVASVILRPRLRRPPEGAWRIGRRWRGAGRETRSMRCRLLWGAMLLALGTVACRAGAAPASGRLRPGRPRFPRRAAPRAPQEPARQWRRRRSRARCARKSGGLAQPAAVQGRRRARVLPRQRASRSSGCPWRLN